MLKSAVIKVGLREPPGRVQEMISAVRSFGIKEVHLVHVRTTGARLAPKKRASLDRLLEEARNLDLTAELHLLEGHAPTRIIQAAWQLGVDCICIAWVHKAVLRQTLLGSIDGDILRLSDIPVFIYKRRLLTPAGEMNSVLYATDFKATDAAVMPYLTSTDFQARTLHMLHVRERAPDPATDKARSDTVAANLSRLAAECGRTYDAVETMQAVGPTRRLIVKKAKSLGVDLIVVGKSDNPDMITQLAGSTAEYLPHRALCSVFIIPGAAPSPRSQGAAA